MQVVERERIIPPQPERVAKETVYIASDGKEFRFKSDCELYERNLEIQKHPVFASRIAGVRTFDDEYGATLYYLGSQEDYAFWLAHAGAYNLRVNQWNEGYGRGWYLYYSVDGGDYADDHYLYKLDEYYRSIKHDLEEWYDDIDRKLPESPEKVVKPNCKRCEYLEVNTHSDESYCMHPVADGEQIFVDYPQQRRPKWCPLMEDPA